jgi:hypothetical protein
MRKLCVPGRNIPFQACWNLEPSDCLGSHCCKMWSNGDLVSHCCATMYSNYDLVSHCCNNVFQRWSFPHCCNNVFQLWSCFPLLQQCVPTMIFSHCCNNVFQRWSCFPLLQQCVPAMTSSHASCLVPRKNTTDRHRGMEGPIKHSLLTLEREEHLITCRTLSPNPQYAFITCCWDNLTYF